MKVLVEADDDDWLREAIRQPSRDDADDARAPSFTADDDGRAIRPFFAIDLGDPEAYANCFTEDGAFLLANKIYSPNYDLWIVPFFA